PTRRVGLGPVARSGQEGGLQPQSLPVHIPLVLGLQRRPAHEFRHPLPGHDPVAPHQPAAKGGVAVRRQVGVHDKREVPDTLAGLAWDLCLGPAKRLAYTPNRCQYIFRWSWNYGAGQLTNFGTHYLDMIQWRSTSRRPRAWWRSAASTRSTTTARSPTPWPS